MQSQPIATATLAEPPPWRRDANVIGLVGLAHGISHFSQLLLAPLFPWLKTAFGVSYTQLGLLLTIFFVVSSVSQFASGFYVDRHGPRPVLFGGLLLIGFAALGFAASPSYGWLALCSVVAGVGNGVFHPADYTLLNRKIHKSRLGHAYSVHGVTGSLGWALAPALLVPITLASSWRVALLCAAALIFTVVAVLWLRRDLLALPGTQAVRQPTAAGGAVTGTVSAMGTLAAPLVAPAASPASAASEHVMAFLRIPAVWMSFGFFFFYAGALSIVQSFAPESARQLHGVPAPLAALCLSIYMVCSAAGMVAGGFLARDLGRAERIVGAAFGLAAMVALVIGFAPVAALMVPVLFGAMGFVSGLAGPSRDLIVKSAAPDNASGRVYGVVYAGLDIGQAVVPLVIGAMMDLHAWRSVWLALALLQGVLIVSAFNVRRVRRTASVGAAVPA
ncbi:MAG: MFS transporter [Rubrivivax sp.]